MVLLAQQHVCIFNPRRACAARVTVLGRVSVCLSVCVSVCVSVRLSVCLSIRPSVKSHLTSGASVRPENTVVYSVGNGDQKIYGVSGFNLDMSP